MRKLVALASVAFAFAGSAYAADMPVAYKAPPLPPAPMWAGWYVGIHGGWGWGDDPFTSTFIVDGAQVPVGGFKSNGGVLGGHAGYNWQYGSFVTGFEFDLSGTGISGKSTGVVVGDGAKSVTIQDRFNYLGTARARVGVLPWHNVLLYGTAGLAWTRFTQDRTIADIEGDADDFNRIVTTSTPNDKFGWVAGTGAEMSLASYGLHNWLARVEYLHYDFGTVGTANTTITNSAGGVTSLTGITSSGRLTADVVRGGLSFKLN
jgi:outer membrane immunogenic protein